MKKIGRQVRNVCIAAISLLGIAHIYRALHKGPLVRVVVFHDVKDEQWFNRMAGCMARRYHVLSPQEFIERKYDDAKINVLITFDDGYASWVERCIPILERYEAKAVFFVNSGLIDVHGNGEAQREYVRSRLLLSSRETLSWEGVKALQAAGHMVGGHTTTHARLSLLPAEVQREEIKGDHQNISSHLGFAPVLFAYPFGRKGDYNDVSKGIVKEVGYTHAFSTESKFVSIEGDRYAIHRLCLEDRITERQLSRWIDGAYDVYAYLKNLCAG